MDKTTAITLVLAAPRGFCAGVERAVLIVERALEQFGAPVYVRHEIVHNAYVVDTLRGKGAIFIEELSDIPPAHHDRPVIFSAHGVPKSVPAEAQAMNLLYIDATCPLVSKVHNEAERHHREGRHIVLIGHKGHPEVIGTMGQLPDGAVTLVETVADVDALQFSPDVKLAYTTQTTLSVDDTTAVVLALRSKFPAIMGPQREDICYATTNRQDAVKALAAQADVVLVIGAPNSSNANRLVEVARAAGVKQATLIQGAQDIPFDWITSGMRVGIASGASTPEVLVDAVRKALAAQYTVTTEDLILRTEDVTFRLPKPLRDEAA